MDVPVLAGAQQVSQSPAPDSGPLAKVITPYAFSRRMSVKICIVEEKYSRRNEDQFSNVIKAQPLIYGSTSPFHPISNFENPTPVTTPSFEKP
jgi:hypothetical protein